MLELKCDTRQLHRGLSLVSRAVPLKTTLPVLTNVKLEAIMPQLAFNYQAELEVKPENSPGPGSFSASAGLRLSATNLEYAISLMIEATVTQPGELTAPARLFTDYVASLTGEGGEISLGWNEEKLTLLLQSGRSQATLRGFDPEDYPALPAHTQPPPFGANPSARISLEPVLTLEARVLSQAISQVAFAASSDVVRPAMTAVLFKIENQTLTLVASDSLRMAITQLDLALKTAVTPPLALLIPAKSIMELAYLLNATTVTRPVQSHNHSHPHYQSHSKNVASSPPTSPEEGEQGGLVKISLTPNRSQVHFQTEHFEFSTALIEANYPRYEQIIPKSCTTRLILSTGELVQAVKMARLFAAYQTGGAGIQGGNIVKLAMISHDPAPDQEITTVGTLTLTANTPEVGQNQSELDVEVTGLPLQIAFNASFLLDGLAAIQTPQVALEFSGSTAPGVIKPYGPSPYQPQPKTKAYLYVLMPMHLAAAPASTNPLRPSSSSSSSSKSAEASQPEGHSAAA